MAATLLARYRVRDVDAFRMVFEEFEPTRRAHGATGHTLLQSGPYQVMALIDFPQSEAAHRFADDPARMAALERAGVLDREDVLATLVERSIYPVTTDVAAIAR